MARMPWLDSDGDIVAPSIMTKEDFLVIGLAFTHDVLASAAIAVERVRYGVMGHYNNDVAAGEIADIVRMEEFETEE